MWTGNTFQFSIQTPLLALASIHLLSPTTHRRCMSPRHALCGTSSSLNLKGSRTCRRQHLSCCLESLLCPLLTNALRACCLLGCF